MSGLTNSQKMTPELRRTVALWCAQSAAGLAAYGAILLLAAGSARWVWGWAQLALAAAALYGQVIVLLPINPALLVEREKGLRAEGTKRWDRWVTMASASLGTIVLWVVAGLDFRFGWSGGVALVAHLAGLAVSAAGYALFLWAMVANAFFAEGVRIQKERGHTVASGGPYRAIRHPGYAGAVLGIIASPFLLGSRWALIPAVLAVGGYVVRTALEDQTLQDELPGYRDYARRTRFRLLPGVW